MCHLIKGIFSKDIIMVKQPIVIPCRKPYRLVCVLRDPVILVPAYETQRVYMEALIESCIGQTYANWELVIADGSASDVVYFAVTRSHAATTASPYPFFLL